MTKKLINELVKASYLHDQLDKKKVERIVKLLTRKELKQYIRALKLAEKSKTVSLVLPDVSVYNTNRKKFEELFKGKRIEVVEDPSLLLGVKVINNDNVYDLSLKNSLESFSNEIEQTV